MMKRELILKMSISIDGFVSGPNREFEWAFRTMSDAGRAWNLELLGQAGLHALGRRAYQEMGGYWPTSPLPLARPMNEIPKVVFSKSGAVSAPSVKDAEKADPTELEGWLNPIVAGKDLVADVQRLKAEDGKPILVHGGSAFASSVVAAKLVDRFYLVVHPVALGRGLPLFAELESPLHFKLEELKQFETGVVVKTYLPLYD
jgi:dihydrofolate reductase